jgi:hypothetical protein
MIGNRLHVGPVRIADDRTVPERPWTPFHPTLGPPNTHTRSGEKATMPHLPLSLSSMVARCEGFIDAEADSEVATIDIDKGTCYCFNRQGSRIWSTLSTPIRIGDLCAALISEYDVELSVCERQVLDLLEELRAEGMITDCQK